MYTDTFDADAVGAPEAIRATVACHKILIQEQGGQGNAAFTIYPPADPNGTGSGKSCPGGAQFLFERPATQAPFNPNEIVGYAKAATGTITFSRQHD